MFFNKPEVETIVANFAKSHKVGKAKVFAMLSEIAAHSPARAAGKPVSEESKRIREHLQKMADENKGVNFTCKEIAESLGVPPAHVNNNLNWLKKQGVVVENVGKAERPAGTRGKPAYIYRFA